MANYINCYAGESTTPLCPLLNVTVPSSKPVLSNSSNFIINLVDNKGLYEVSYLLHKIRYVYVPCCIMCIY